MCECSCLGAKMRSCLTCVVSASHNVSTSRSCPADLTWVRLLMSLQAYDCVSQEVPQLVCQLVTHMLAGCPPAVLQRVVAAGCKIAIIGRRQVWVLGAGARFEVIWNWSEQTATTNWQLTLLLHRVSVLPWHCGEQAGAA